MASYFDPTIRSFNFGIPTVLGIMGHFIISVLSESNGFWSNTYINKELICSCHEVSKSLVINYTICNCGIKRQISDNSSFIGKLVLFAEKWKHHIGNSMEFVMFFVLWVYEMFNFSHGKFSYSQ